MARSGAPSTLWFSETFGFHESNWAETIEKFQVTQQPPGHYKLTSLKNDKTFDVGPFECVSLSSLSKLLAKEEAAGAPLALGGLKFENIIGDVRQLHRAPENEGAVFQVASQFNCLEMVNQGVRPEDGITRYARDLTQGPACALCCPGATVFRNYFVNDVGQAGPNQLNLLDDVEELVDNKTEKYWTVMNGYCLPVNSHSIGLFGLKLKDEPEIAKMVREYLKVGVHWDTEVDTVGQHVCQIFCSALPIAYAANVPDEDWEPFAKIVLEAAYACTLAAAYLLALQRKQRVKVYLTALGGGAFGNPHPWIALGMENALKAYRNAPLDVDLVHFHSIPDDCYENLPLSIQ